jgi:hypothetical protein
MAERYDDDKRQYNGVHSKETLQKMQQVAQEHGLRVTTIDDKYHSTLTEGNHFVQVEGFGSEGLTKFWSGVKGSENNPQ